MPLNKDLFLEIQGALHECQFLREVTAPVGDPQFLYCELVGALTQYLPENKSVIVIERSRFTASLLRSLYAELIVSWLAEAHEKALDLARIPPRKSP